MDSETSEQVPLRVEEQDFTPETVYDDSSRPDRMTHTMLQVNDIMQQN